MVMENKWSEEIKCCFDKIPFKVSLSFEYLITDIEAISIQKDHPMSIMAVHVLSEIDKVPAFKTVINDFSLLEKHKGLVGKLMAFVINPMNDHTDLVATSAPFAWESFYSTTLFKQTILNEHKSLDIVIDSYKGENLLLLSILFHAYILILDQIYGIDIYKDFPFNFKLTCEQTSLVKYYNSKINNRYIKVIPPANYKKLSKEQLKSLFGKENDLTFWNELIPLEDFEFVGFKRLDFRDITYDYTISQLKSDLLNKNTIVSNEGFQKIKSRVHSLIGNPYVEFGYVATCDFDPELNRNYIWKSIIPLSELGFQDYLDSFYREAYTERKIIIIDDLKKEKKNRLVDAFLKRGIRNHAIVPLILENEVVGIVEFACAEPGSLSMVQIKRMYELFPIFALAIKRSKEEWDDKVRAIIQEEFTAIHPTVEWRFREAVTTLLNQKLEQEKTAIEPIVFPGVFPIYGASDIRGSSLERNKAIQADLTEQLTQARGVLMSSDVLKDILLVNNLIFKVDAHIKTVKSGLKAGDEVSILDFLQREIDPVLKTLAGRYLELKDPVNSYFEKLDPELGVIYNKRKNFEESLTVINDNVSEIVDAEQIKAQKVFPHYFEKYRTDGVEYNAYLGQSLVKNLPFSDIYLNNIRLWQLMLKVKIARRIKKIQAELSTKLDITQLILIHSSPLSIAFRQDERKFDVDGAYNIRYEITKKRIDKAIIKGTRERITQVGKIAIIYSYAEEIQEYKKYIDFMIAQGFLKDVVEDYELEDMKGASGLRALRIEVDFTDLEVKPLDDSVINELMVG
jgi:hypothetical protein